MTVDNVAHQLAEEFRQLRQVRPGDNAQTVATFTVKAMEAYTLTAALQACSRHPGLSDTQRELVLGFAHQISDQLVAMARAIVGADSAIETTIAMGFDPQFDVSRDQEAPDADDLDDLSFDGDEVEDSHILGERRINYVEPKWIALSTDPEDAELSKCARCSRFFVQDIPIRLFQDLGEQVVLGFEVCEECAPSVLTRMQR